MHELSIADSIARIAAEYASGRRVERVIVRVGALRQVVPEALESAFELVIQRTGLEGAVLELAPVPVAVACGRCGADSEPVTFPLACATCGSLDTEVVRGDELSVEALDVSDEVVP